MREPDRYETEQSDTLLYRNLKGNQIIGGVQWYTMKVGGSGEYNDPLHAIAQDPTQAIVNLETLSNSVSRSDSHHEGIHTSTGYQAVVNHLLEKVMGQGCLENQL